MKHILTSVVAFLVAVPALAQNNVWKLDKAQSELVVKVWKTGAAASLAHDHVVRASQFAVALTLDDATKLDSLKFNVTVDVSSLTPDEPEVRKRHSVAGPEVPDADRKKVAEQMLGSEQLDALKFPTITFQSMGVAPAEKGGFQCSGTLTLHGQTRKVEFPCTVAVSGGRIEGNAKLKFRPSDFGIKPFSAALGLIRNKDEAELVIRLVAARS